MFFKKSKIFEDIFLFGNKKKYSLFLNIRYMQFDQSSQVQPNPEKKIWKNLEMSLFFQKIWNF